MRRFERYEQLLRTPDDEQELLSEARREAQQNLNDAYRFAHIPLPAGSTAPGHWEADNAGVWTRTVEFTRRAEDRPGSDSTGLTALEQWELYMRGAGRSNRTISETIGVLRRMEKFAATRVECVRPLDIARFLGRRLLKQNSRAAYYGYIHAFYQWWGENGGSNTAGNLPRP